MRRASLAVVAAGVLFATAPPAVDAVAAPGGTGHRLEIFAGLRIGAFEPTNSQRSYDAVFGGAMLQGGAELDLGVGRHLLVLLAADYGRVDGERVLPTTPPRKTGIGERLTLLPVHLDAGWQLRPGRIWVPYLAAGPTWLHWRDASGDQSRSADDFGGNVLVGLRRDAARWSFGGEVRYSSIPDAIGRGGISKLFGEDDLGGFALHFVARRRLR